MKAYEELARSQRQETVWRKEARAQEREAKAQETLRYKAENIARYEMGEKQKKIHEIGALEEEIQRVHDHFIRSTSWRITAPLRALGRMKTGAPSLRSVRALKHAIQYHGVRGGLRKVFVVARKKGPVGLFNQLGHSLAQHNTITEPAAGRHEYLELMDARNEFLASLGERPAPALAPDPGVLIISDTTLPQCIHYRIRNKIEMLNAHDVQAEFCNPHDIAQTLSKMQYYRVVLFYRMQMDDLFMLYHDEARRLGASIAYDLDDPMFDRAVLGGNENLKMIEPHHRIYQLREANRIRQAMDACDYLIASTPGLAELMGSATGGKQAYVWRNVASQETLALGSETQQRITRGASGRIRLGYFSGSLAHEADFDIAAPALADLMACRDDVDLLLFGHVCSRKILEPFSKRILIQNFSDYPHYLEAVAGCDAILVPLLDNPFNRCKSIVRYIDAAVVETPVLASRVGDYDALITHGQTGWLAGPDQWRAALEEVCTLGDKRCGVGANARRFIEEKFSTLTNMPVLDEPARKQIFGN